MIVWFNSQASVETIGRKGFNLCRMTQASLPVPGGFCVTVEGLASIGVQELDGALEQLGAGALAVRSSAVEEDALSASFAGIYATRLNVVTSEEVLEALREIRDSASTPSAIAYRRQRGIAGAPRMAAVVQTLLVPDASGILFMKDPVAGSDRIVVEGSWGLGEAVVDGKVTPDHWVLSHTGEVISFDIADKDIAIVPGKSGTRQIEVDHARRKLPCLDAGRLMRLLELGCACKQLFGAPQDIEWATTSDQVWLLQSRPITR